MSQNNTQERSLTHLRTTLEGLSIQELRKRASQNFGLKLTRESTKEDIINQIVGVAHKADYAQLSDGDLQPGWARIKVHPIAGRSTFPFYVNCNGYQCFIPFNVEVDVPRKLINLLRDAEEFKVGQNEFGERVDSFELSYPFTTIQDIPGPDPRPGLEAQREIRLAPKRRFYDRFGYWPTDKALEAYRNGSLVPESNDN